MTAAPLGPRASVCAVVPHFECERWLAQALESLLDQTRPPDAVVVVDDGSGEPPVDIVREHPEVTLLAAADNGGPYRLVQAVIDRTGYDAYLFQDADDWSAADRLEALLDEAARSGAELVGSHEMRILVDEGDIVPVRYPLDVNAVLRERPTAYPLLHPTSLLAGGLARRLGGFATGMRFSGDAELLRRAAHVATVTNADHFGYFRRKRRGSLTLGSGTELGSPARQAVQEVLAERARANAQRVAAGRAPDLRPLRTAPAPDLRHLAGPPLGERTPRRPRRTPDPGGGPAGPVFVVGAPRSGAAVLGLALDQHPRLRLLHDSRWLARAAADVELRASEEAAAPPPAFRERLADALRAVAAGGGRRPVASGGDLLPAAHALARLFPDARFVHVVRGGAETVAALATAPTEQGTYFTADAAWRAWVTATELGLDLEAALGPDAVVRVAYDDLAADPEGTVRACLERLGEQPARACARPLTDLAAGGPTGAPAPPAGLADRVRALHDRLRSPLPTGPDGAARGRLADRFRRDWTGSRPGGSLVERMRALVAAAVPDGSTVAVVSRGDPRLLDLGGRVGWHVPQVEGGVYAGHHPAHSDDAVAQVDALRARGAEYLAVPATSLWWLTFYDGLRRHLADSASLVAFQEDVGAVFRLAPAPVAAGDGPPPPAFVPVAARAAREVRAS